MTPKRVTLKQIAQHAGCSAAVVSTVLNRSRGNTKVSENTRRRIIEIAEQYNYHPNFASRSLKMSRSKTIGIYIYAAPWQQLSNIYEMQIFKGIEKAAREKGYDLLLINIGGHVAPEICAAKIAEHRIDGVLLLHAEPGSDWLDQLLQLTTNVVAIDFSHNKSGLDSMSFDNTAAIKQALCHLKELGHHRVGFIGSCLETPATDAYQRQQAFSLLSKQLELADDPDLVFCNRNCKEAIIVESLYCQQEGRLGAEYFLKKSQPPTAIICYNDLVAVEAMKLMTSYGMSLPEQMSIIGIDDSEWCQYTTPPLTSVKHPLGQMGYEGTMLLIDKTEDKAKEENIHKSFQPKLIIRGSTTNSK